MKLLFVIVSFFSIQSFGYFLSTGTHVPYLAKAQTNNSGSTEIFSINPYFGIGTQLNLGKAHYFSPEIGYAYYADGVEGSRSESILLQYNFSYVLTNQFALRYGLSNHWFRIVGKGGTVTLNNGSDTREFAAPSRTVTSYYSTLNFGLEYMFQSKKFSLRFDLNMMNFREFENRVFNYLLTFNFYRF